jgi:hypothetical protein
LLATNGQLLAGGNFRNVSGGIAATKIEYWDGDVERSTLRRRIQNRRRKTLVPFRGMERVSSEVGRTVVMEWHATIVNFLPASFGALEYFVFWLLKAQLEEFSVSCRVSDY